MQLKEFFSYIALTPRGFFLLRPASQLLHSSNIINLLAEKLYASPDNAKHIPADPPLATSTAMCNVFIRYQAFLEIQDQPAHELSNHLHL